MSAEIIAFPRRKPASSTTLTVAAPLIAVAFGIIVLMCSPSAKGEGSDQAVPMLMGP